MSLRTNAVLRFDSYRVGDTGIVMAFTCLDPGAGETTEYLVQLTDVELAGASNQAQLRTLVTDRLNRRYRAVGIATKLDQFVGQTITI